MNLTRQRLKELFDYNPETDELIRKVYPGIRKCFIGKPAGTPSTHGHIQIKVDGKKYGKGQLVALYLGKPYTPPVTRRVPPPGRKKKADPRLVQEFLCRAWV